MDKTWRPFRSIQYNMSQWQRLVTPWFIYAPVGPSRGDANTGGRMPTQLPPGLFPLSHGGMPTAGHTLIAAWLSCGLISPRGRFCTPHSGQLPQWSAGIWVFSAFQEPLVCLPHRQCCSDLLWSLPALETQGTYQWWQSRPWKCWFVPELLSRV